MRIHSLFLKNYRPFATLEEIRLGQLATIVGQNDVGKSNILRALELFFEQGHALEESDIYTRAPAGEDIVIEVAFTSLPREIELEEGVMTTIENEMLVDPDGYLRIRKTYDRSDPGKLTIRLITLDFNDDRFAGLSILKESDLNARCKDVCIQVSRSGRGITNESKRQALRAKAREIGVMQVRRELSVTKKDDLWKKIVDLLPRFELFETDTRLGVGETGFQGQFRSVVETAAAKPDAIEARDIFSRVIASGLQIEVDEIFERLKRHTDAFLSLTVKPEFSWDKAVRFEIFGKDRDGVDNSLDRRGSGMRRLLMVSFFQYIAERRAGGEPDFIFAVEEPENCLHPGLQRELIKSFRSLADKGYQVIVTSHSPVFVGGSPIDDLALVVREAGVARAIQKPELDLSDVAEQLGVEPCDQITGYSACVFVEGPADILFWKTVASKLKEGGHLLYDFDDKQIGFVICGGETLRHWVNLRCMKRLNRRFGVVVDSDKKSERDNIPQRKLNWKQKCEEDGGLFFIVRKRTIENYLHHAAITRSGRPAVRYDGFTDMKSLFGDNVFKVISDMSPAEIMEMDKYYDSGTEHHELLEIVQALLTLPVNPNSPE
jgi:putative ATP-dependent endonuclease of OLD family